MLTKKKIRTPEGVEVIRNRGRPGTNKAMGLKRVYFFGINGVAQGEKNLVEYTMVYFGRVHMARPRGFVGEEPAATEPATGPAASPSVQSTSSSLAISDTFLHSGLNVLMKWYCCSVCWVSDIGFCKIGSSDILLVHGFVCRYLKLAVNLVRIKLIVVNKNDGC
ncbi:uncharacterized protein LOC113463010 [Phoenix dactylifera]|uniref:Uncharacterized protein LOC113463010 n=1 Tax=Phoenix dactylifera TaxID=42345 RepID=A0A8B8J6Y6_PHODC|nr:uncharacterized protein LOC113463010 [Phoenix dactylifera]